MFQRLHNGDNCPLCTEGELERIERKSWMHLFPQSKHYVCLECSICFLTLYGRLMKILPKDENLTKFKIKKRRKALNPQGGMN
jgi:hypothetical protein